MIRFENYINTAKKFSHDTMDWTKLGDGFYTSCKSTNDWEESCDNSMNRIDVSWAFQMSEAEIEQQAISRLYEMLTEELQQAVDEGYDTEQLQCIVDKYTDL